VSKFSTKYLNRTKAAGVRGES